LLSCFLNGQATIEITETLVAMVSKLSDEVAHLKIDYVELKNKLVISTSGRNKEQVLSGHCLPCPTAKLQQAGRSVSKL
jgi:hypothetical protein